MEWQLFAEFVDNILKFAVIATSGTSASLLYFVCIDQTQSRTWKEFKVQWRRSVEKNCVFCNYQKREAFLSYRFNKKRIDKISCALMSKQSFQLMEINDWAFQWKMGFNADPRKQTQEKTFSRNINKIYKPSLYFNKNLVIPSSTQSISEWY